MHHTGVEKRSARVRVGGRQGGKEVALRVGGCEVYCDRLLGYVSEFATAARLTAVWKQQAHQVSVFFCFFQSLSSRVRVPSPSRLFRRVCRRYVAVAKVVPCRSVLRHAVAAPLIRATMYFPRIIPSATYALHSLRFIREWKKKWLLCRVFLTRRTCVQYAQTKTTLA